MSGRFYDKTTVDATALSYISDGEGRIVGKFTKRYLFSQAQVRASILNFPLINPKNSQIKCFLYQLLTDAGVVHQGSAHHAWTLVDNRHTLRLTIADDAAGAITAGSVLTIYYEVA